MSDGRRILPPDQVEHEIKRREDQNAPDASNPENNLGEFHLAASGPLTAHLGMAAAAVQASAKPGATPSKCRASLSNAGFPCLGRAAAQRRLSSSLVGCTLVRTRPSRNYSPPTVSPSTRIVGAATDPRNSRSFANLRNVEEHFLQISRHRDLFHRIRQFSLRRSTSPRPRANSRRSPGSRPCPRNSVT